MNTPQVIDLTDGAVEYTWPLTLTELSGKNISGDTVQMAIGSQSVATAIQTWCTPDVVTESTITAKEFILQNPGVPGVEVPEGVDPATLTLYQVTAQLLIGASTTNHPSIAPTTGTTIYPYIQITDTPEIVPRRGQQISIT